MENLIKAGSAASKIKNDVTLISAILENWETYVSENTNMDSLFTYEGEKIYGLGLSFNDYVALIGTPNCHAFKVRFGYDPAAAALSKFKMVIWGVDADGEQVTGFVQPDKILTSSPMSLNNSPDPTGGLVAPQMAELWLDNWNNLSDYDSGIFKVGVYPERTIEVLRGYNFTSDDFHEVIDINNGAIDTVYFLNVCHDIIPAIEGENPQLFGTMIAAMNSTGTVLSNYYDLSAPCPKTC